MILLCLSVCPALSVCICVPLCFVRVCMSRSVCVCPGLSVSVNGPLCLCLSVSDWLCLSVSRSVGVYLCLTVSVCICLRLSAYVCVYQSLSGALHWMSAIALAIMHAAAHCEPPLKGHLEAFDGIIFAQPLLLKPLAVFIARSSSPISESISEIHTCLFNYMHVLIYNTIQYDIIRYNTIQYNTRVFDIAFP